MSSWDRRVMFNGGTQTMHHGEVCFLDGGGLVDRDQQGRVAQVGGRSATAQQANGLNSSMTGNLQGVDDVSAFSAGAQHDQNVFWTQQRFELS